MGLTDFVNELDLDGDNQLAVSKAFFAKEKALFPAGRLVGSNVSDLLRMLFEEEEKLKREQDAVHEQVRIERLKKDAIETNLITLPSDNMLIAIGDLHGNFDALEKLLSKLQAHHDIFSHGDTLNSGITLIFMGDYIDRGRDGLKVIDRIRRLQRVNGERVSALIGNHEILALEALDIVRNYAYNIQSGQMSVSSALLDYAQNHTHGANGGDKFVKEFGSTIEEAFKNYVNRMSRKGDIGEWIRYELKALKIVEFKGKKILFTHADIPSSFKTLNELNQYERDFRGELDQVTGPDGTTTKYSAPLFNAGSLFWNRRFTKSSDVEGIEASLRGFPFDYYVVGHTIRPNIHMIGSNIVMTDVGMYRTTSQSALLIRGPGMYSFKINEDGVVDEKMIKGFDKVN